LKVASLIQSLLYYAKLNFLQLLVLLIWHLSFLRSVKEMQEPVQHDIVIGYGPVQHSIVIGYRPLQHNIGYRPNELGFDSLEENIKTGC